MVVLEEYLQLYERDSKLVSSAWKIFHIIFYIIIALSGIAASYTFRQVLESFGGNCILHSNVTFTSETDDNSSVCVIDCGKSEWGRQSDCSFCQYVPVCSVIFSIVWITFFLMCGRGGKTARGLSQPWRIVVPSLIFNITFVGVALAAACKLNDATDVFCNFLQGDTDESNKKCKDIAKFLLMEGNSGLLTYGYMKAAQVSAWINVVGWTMSVLMLLLRCFCAPDFQLIEISILAPTPEQEHALSSSQESIDVGCEDMIGQGEVRAKESEA